MTEALQGDEAMEIKTTPQISMKDSNDNYNSYYHTMVVSDQLAVNSDKN